MHTIKPLDKESVVKSAVKEIENSLASVFEALNSILDALKNLEN